MKKVLLAVMLLGGYLSVSAQLNPGRLTLGGGLGVQFGDYTLINVSPQLGYNINRSLNVGVGFSYSYLGEKVLHTRYKQSYLGFNVHAKLYPLSFLVLSIQPEANRMWKTVENKESNIKDRTSKFVPSCVVGGGLRIGPITAMLKYDLAQNSDSPYGTKIFYSLGYMFAIR